LALRDRVAGRPAFLQTTFTVLAARRIFDYTRPLSPLSPAMPLSPQPRKQAEARKKAFSTSASPLFFSRWRPSSRFFRQGKRFFFFFIVEGTKDMSLVAGTRMPFFFS